MADTNEKICFVIAPIGEPESDIRKRSDQVLKHIIRPAVESCGYKAVRADEIAQPGIITNQIIRHVVDDPLVIADLTGQNANVFYELAIRHYIGKPLVQIIDNVENIPFDVGSMRTIQVDHRDLDSVEEAKTEIKRQIQSFEESSSSLESPISVALAGRFIDEIKKRDQNHLEEDIKKIRDQNDEILRRMDAEKVADEPEKAKQVVAYVSEIPMASLIDKAIAQAVFLQQRGKIEEAMETWRAIAHTAEEIDNDQAARAWFSVGYLLENPEDSISAYNRAIRLQPDAAESYNNRGTAKGKLGQGADAIADYDEAIRLKPGFVEAYYNRGSTKEELGQIAEAIADYDKAIRLKPDFADAYSNQGVAKVRLERYDDAIADYDEAILLKPGFVEAYYNRGSAKVALGQYAEAIVDYDTAILLQPDYAEAYYNRGNAKGALGQYDDAIADYDETIRLKPDYAEAYSNRGNAKAGLSQPEDAIADYDATILLQPGFVEAYYNRGNAKGALGQYDDAIADYDEAIRLKPDHAKAYNNRGFAKGALGQYDDAIADYDEVIRLKPDHAKVYKNRGFAKGALGQYADAIADFDEGICLQPDDAAAYYSRSLAKRALGLIDEARKDFGNARDLAREAGNDSLADAAEQGLRDLDADDT